MKYTEERKKIIRTFLNDMLDQAHDAKYRQLAENIGSPSKKGSELYEMHKNEFEVIRKLYHQVNSL
jgi:hypothetical protein